MNQTPIIITKTPEPEYSPMFCFSMKGKNYFICYTIVALCIFTGLCTIRGIFYMEERSIAIENLENLKEQRALDQNRETDFGRMNGDVDNAQKFAGQFNLPQIDQFNNVIDNIQHKVDVDSNQIYSGLDKMANQYLPDEINDKIKGQMLQTRTVSEELEEALDVELPSTFFLFYFLGAIFAMTSLIKYCITKNFGQISDLVFAFYYGGVFTISYLSLLFIILSFIFL